MKFQKNKDGYIEVEYEGSYYFLDGKKWVRDFKIDNSTYYSNTGHNTTRKFIIPVGQLSRKQAEKQIKQLMAQYTDKEVFYDEIQSKLTRLLRKAKLDQLKNVEIL